jgi:uncharacterized protein YicC (UPF0701 family)
MRIAKNTLLALCACALLVSAGCAEEEKIVVETPVVEEGEPTQLPADIEKAVDAAVEDAKESVDELKAARKAEVQRLKAELQANVEDLEAQIAADPMKAVDLQKMIEDLTADYQAQIDAVKADYKARIEAAQ